ncbi:hypothetical protein BS50DRAFT_90671 [Corynespora cassiicola Philippines]|uniref:Uncharacterized protein n=1 Tax=Corynespora cassiicola Philippines TaxID=1448308 RepID=A0A2T2NEI8_CORCC|nr:hypothetical protein BS50DRAFT_90671 [Corynespora cassiicola Philippines]
MRQRPGGCEEMTLQRRQRPLSCTITTTTAAGPTTTTTTTTVAARTTWARWHACMQGLRRAVSGTELPGVRVCLASNCKGNPIPLRTTPVSVGCCRPWMLGGTASEQIKLQTPALWRGAVLWLALSRHPWTEPKVRVRHRTLPSLSAHRRADARKNKMRSVASTSPTSR